MAETKTACLIQRRTLWAAGLIWALTASLPSAQQTGGCEPVFTPAAIGGALPVANGLLEKRRKLQILAIGSSSTFGIGATAPGKTYPAQLQGLLRAALGENKVDVQNLGISGETIAATLPRMKFDVQRLSPVLVLWQLGTNDALGNVSLEKFEVDVEEGLQWLNRSGSDVMLIGMQWTPALARNERYQAFNASLAKIALRRNVPFVQRYEAMHAAAGRGVIAEMLSRDNFHLSDTGYYCLAEQAARAILMRVSAPPARAVEIPR